MDSRSLASSLKTRANIYHTRKIVQEHTDKVARDWDGLEIQIADEAKKNAKLAASLSEYLQSELENNYKIIALYKLTAKSKKSFLDLYSSVNSKVRKDYPTVLEGTKLAALSQLLTVASCSQTADFTRIVLTRRRTFTLRQKIDKKKLGNVAEKALTVYDDVFGVADYHWQTFDVISLNHVTGVLEFRADYTRAANSYQNAKQIDLSLAEALGWVVFNCAQMKKPFDSSGAINLFPAIAHFAFNDDGHISKLHFMTPQGSIKQDTMKKGEDLRNEVFHKKGLEAVGGMITPFDISVIWHVTNRFGPGQEIELTIPSSLSAASMGNSANQTYAILRYCSTPDDTKLLVDKLLEATKP
ncbi:hypothetical protein HU732_14455 [Pseudomonas proteolytica]|jgi:hypothetical protein|uniref:hypothetical protein n=1 Tax=Pseudomonas proteolytica TaxID=219574 RepID=UPI001647DBA4|nr:hypothetical protein [Pseudomonas proteolytica]MBC3337502.1 hypothetical protein [Pseudomonas proteolytica]